MSYSTAVFIPVGLKAGSYVLSCAVALTVSKQSRILADGLEAAFVAVLIEHWTAILDYVGSNRFSDFSPHDTLYLNFTGR